MLSPGQPADNRSTTRTRGRPTSLFGAVRRELPPVSTRWQQTCVVAGGLNVLDGTAIMVAPGVPVPMRATPAPSWQVSGSESAARARSGGGVVAHDSRQDMFPWRCVPVLGRQVGEQRVRQILGRVTREGRLAPRTVQRESVHGHQSPRHRDGEPRTNRPSHLAERGRPWTTSPVRRRTCGRMIQVAAGREGEAA